jgi:hypothetical protein
VLLRFVLITGAFAVTVLAANDSPLSLFPDQSKSLAQLSRQALDKQINAAISGKQVPSAVNPTNIPGERIMVVNNCAIPLDEVNILNPRKLDPMAKSAGSATFDRMAKRTSIPACKGWK